MTDGELPLFPLSTVLFPGGPLRLRIFETRYLDMVRRCFREGSEFGVVLIREGGEVGEVTALAELGTTARLTDFEPRADGLLGVSCIGERRFRISARTQRADGLHVAVVDYLPSEPPEELGADFARLGALLQELLPRLGEYQPLEPQFTDAAWVGYRWAELLPLSMDERQQVLELADPQARLQLVASWAARQPEGLRG
jgi:uncharacterized protein